MKNKKRQKKYQFNNESKMKDNFIKQFNVRKLSNRPHAKQGIC